MIFILKLLFYSEEIKKRKKKKIQKFGYVMTIDIITGYSFGAHCRFSI